MKSIWNDDGGWRDVRVPSVLLLLNAVVYCCTSHTNTYNNNKKNKLPKYKRPKRKQYYTKKTLYIRLFGYQRTKKT